MTQKKKKVKSKTSAKPQTIKKSSTDSRSTSAVRPTESTLRRGKVESPAGSELTFTRTNYLWMLIGVAVIALSLILMAGGKMPSPDVWEPERIYSFRRITLAPILFLIGLGIEIYAIFKH